MLLDKIPKIDSNWLIKKAIILIFAGNSVDVIRKDMLDDMLRMPVKPTIEAPEYSVVQFEYIFGNSGLRDVFHK